MEDSLARLDRVISCVGDLPALPDIVAQVLSITEDPSVAMSRISETVQRDPALTAKILKVSNSAYYGMRQYVGTLKLALVILGVREVRNIVLGISVFERLGDGRVDSLLTRNLWHHSVRVGGLSKRLGTALAMGLEGEDFISGLLHDVGKIALIRQLGPGYMRIFKASGGNSEPLCMLEQETFGFDHADAAAALASHWNLPRTLGDSMCCHHASPDRPLADAKDPRLAALVRIANRAAREDFSDPDAAPGPSCLDAEAWDMLKSAGIPDGVEARSQMLTRFAVGVEEHAVEGA